MYVPAERFVCGDYHLLPCPADMIYQVIERLQGLLLSHPEGRPYPFYHGLGGCVVELPRRSGIRRK